MLTSRGVKTLASLGECGPDQGHVISGFQGPAGVTGLKGSRGSQGQAVSQRG